MIHIKQQKQVHAFRFYLTSILISATGLYLLFAGICELKTRTDENQLTTLRDAVQRCSVQCYAIEGRYPPSVEYLEEHYGLSIDHDRYHVFYSGWASNIMPDITVIPASDS